MGPRPGYANVAGRRPHETRRLYIVTTCICLYIKTIAEIEVFNGEKLNTDRNEQTCMIFSVTLNNWSLFQETKLYYPPDSKETS